MLKPIAMGTDDFKKVIETGSLFIDKTLFIKELIDDTSEAVLFPRPRRFGKTLNMSMLKYFFDIELESRELFKGLKIMQEGAKYLDEMNKYPVIFLTLKEAKQSSYKEFISFFKEIISGLYGKYEFLLNSAKIKQSDKEYFNRCNSSQEEENLSLAISKLSNMLELYYNQKVIILLDEYDAPILEGYLCGHYNETIKFMKTFFSATFKTNLSLKKGIITGVLRISKEGMFSDANNIIIYNMTTPKYTNHFGFTEDEVKNALKEYNLIDQFSKVKKWYDGYNFRGTEIYNPWSILNFLRFGETDTYWVNTGGVDLIKKLIYNSGNNGLLEEYHKMLDTGKIENVNLDLNMDLKYLDSDRNTIWTLFMLAGYFTVEENESSKTNVNMRIPNLEIRKNLENVCINWFEKNINDYSSIEYALLYNNMEKFKNDFSNMIIKSFSYYDVPENETGESFYHAFTMGLLYNNSNNYKITSNREIGFGRYDLILEPKRNSSNYAYIIEFKVAYNGKFDQAIEDAFNQIEKKQYDFLLKDAYEVNHIAIAFYGKKIKIGIR